MTDQNLAGLRFVQRWHATGDYAYPAEEREDGEFVEYEAYCALARENAELLHLPDRIRELRKAEAELATARVALDHIARVALGSRTKTKRANWIAERAKSVLNGDHAWENAPIPKGYHDALEREAPLSVEGDGQ